MSSSEPFNENSETSSLQRIAIGAGTLIVVVLTVVAAIFLAMQELPNDEEPTEVAQASPTATSSPTRQLATAVTATPTTGLETPTASPSPTASATLIPIDTATVPPPTITDTPLPPTATLTPTETIAPATDTPLPPPTPAAPAGGPCQRPEGWVDYQVRPGDTLNSLATRTNSSVFELQQANCLESFTLTEGQIIFLPGVPQTPTPTVTPPATPAREPTATRTATPMLPVVLEVVPRRVDEQVDGQPIPITVLGRNFEPRARAFQVELRGPQSVRLELGESRSETSFDAIVPPGLPAGTYDMVVTNPDDQAGVKTSAFIIGEAPTPGPTPLPPEIIDFTPKSGNIKDDINLRVTGRNFQPNEPGFRVELQKTDGTLNQELERDAGGVQNDVTLEYVVVADTLEVGDYNLVVINPDGRSAIANDRYRAFE